VGQQQNIPITLADLPGATAKPAAPRPWRPDRPGDITSPQQMPWGGAFGTPGPDTGYALRLIRRRGLELEPGIRRDVEAAILAIASARASALGRAPVPDDIDVAMDLLGLDDSAAVSRFAGIAHDNARLRGLVEAVPRETLMAPPGASGGGASAT
jgi:hypothetical protein